MGSTGPSSGNGRRGLALLTFALALLSCDGSNPVAPEPVVGVTETTYAIRLTAETDNAQVLLSETKGVRIRISVVDNHKNAVPPDGTAVTLITNLGNFGTEGQKAIRTLTAGAATIRFYPGTKEGTAEILAAISSSAGKISLEIVKSPPPPIAGFSFKVTGLEATFADESTGVPTKWRWDFGDGHTSKDASPIHEYFERGNYPVSLTVTNDFGSSIKTQIVTAGGEVAPPTSDFTFAVDGLVVTFAEASTGNPTSFEWFFGDGAKSFDPNPRHTYSGPGNYTVSLNVSNAAGTGTKSKIVAVGGEGHAPVADFIFEADGLVVTFADASTGDPTSHSWDFGDGKTSTESNPKHPYSAPGNYAVTLTVSNSSGSSEKSKIVTAGGAPGDAPVADFTFKADGLVVTFADASTGSPTDWSWDFGVGKPKSSTNPNPPPVTFPAGNHTVQLKVSNPAGSSTKSQIVTAGDPVVADFSTMITGKKATFTNQSSGTPPPTSFVWDFGDPNANAMHPNSSTATSPSHTYSQSGSYQVKLTASRPGSSDSGGNKDTVTKNIVIP